MVLGSDGAGQCPTCIVSRLYYSLVDGFLMRDWVRFEMLAFKSDVSDWRQKKELVGVSVRTVGALYRTRAAVMLTQRSDCHKCHCANCHFALSPRQQHRHKLDDSVSLLYCYCWRCLLMSLFYSMGSGMGVVIEAWKVRSRIKLPVHSINNHLDHKGR